MNRKARISVVALVVAYALAPLAAGLFDYGFKSGPRIYPSEYHVVLFTIAYEAIRGEKPRSPVYIERPLFYGMKLKMTARPQNPASQKVYDDYRREYGID